MLPRETPDIEEFTNALLGMLVNVLLLPLSDLFVSVSDPVRDTKSSSDSAVLNSASVPVSVLSVRSNVLLVNVAIPDLT